MRHFHRNALLALLGAAMCLVSLSPARAQGPASSAQPEGFSQALNFTDRMVRIVARRPVGQPNAVGASGYGFIVGEHPTSRGEPGFLVVTADHLIRDPIQPNAEFEPPRVTYYANLAITVPAEVQPQRLAPAQGDLAVLVIQRDVSWHMTTYFMGNPALLQAGTLAWQLGKPGIWQPDPTAGRFAQRDSAGWLLFDGLDTPKGSLGGAVIINRGLIGMVAEDGVPATAATRVLPVDLMADSLRSWNLEWDIGARDAAAPTLPGAASSGPRLSTLAQPALPGLGSLSTGAMPAPVASESRPPPRTLGPQGGTPTPPQARPAAPTANPATGLAPVQIIPLLATELAARTSWVPPNAKVSPWLQTGATLLSAPRREATPVGNLPAGSQLPFELWVNGAYDIVRKLDNGTWYLIASEDQQIGYVAGGDVVEVWPTQDRDAPPAGRLVREWNNADGGRASLRDLSTAYEIATTIKCAQAFCESVLVYTPRPPAPGSTNPTFQVRMIAGKWRQDETATLRLLVPRSVVDTKGVVLMACIGRGANCREQRLLPAN